MRLSDCSAKLRPLQVLNFADCDIEDVTNDSRAVRSGSLFCAIRGAKADGRRFVPAAEAAGVVRRRWRQHHAHKLLRPFPRRPFRFVLNSFKI